MEYTPHFRIKHKSPIIGWKCFPWNYNESFSTRIYDCLPETLGQGIGMFDTAGKEFFVGDLIGDPSLKPQKGKLAEVVFRMGAFMKKFAPDEKDGIIDYARFDEIDHECYKIYGNIHDNPELL